MAKIIIRIFKIIALLVNSCILLWLLYKSFTEGIGDYWYENVLVILMIAFPIVNILAIALKEKDVNK